jgi:hypothetical protein
MGLDGLRNAIVALWERDDLTDEQKYDLMRGMEAAEARDAMLALASQQDPGTALRIRMGEFRWREVKFLITAITDATTAAAAFQAGLEQGRRERRETGEAMYSAIDMQGILLAFAHAVLPDQTVTAQMVGVSDTESADDVHILTSTTASRA